MANGWTPLVLAPPDHHEHLTTSSAPAQLRQRSTTMPTTPTSTTTTASKAVANGSHHNQAATPFDKPLPEKDHLRFIKDIPVGDRYALYTLIPLTHKRTSALVDFIVSSTAAEDWSATVVPAPTHDFSDADKNSLRDVYDYHTSLLKVVRGNPHNLRPNHFLVAASENWDVDGILLVNLDCNPNRQGEIGVTRVPVGMAGSSLMLLEDDPSSWYDFKVGEADTEWPKAIAGYTGSKMHNPGMEWFRCYAHDEMGGELRI